VIPPSDGAAIAERDFLRSLPRGSHQKRMVGRAMSMVIAETTVSGRTLTSEEWAAVRAGMEWAVLAWGDWMLQADYIFIPAEMVTSDQLGQVWGPIRPAIDPALMNSDNDTDEDDDDDGHGD
jgi:hypothetical protein